jgi:hypothetical protein
VRPEIDPALKAEALQLAEEHGPQVASERTGIPASTIRVWRTRAKQAISPTGELPADMSTERAKKTAEAARDAADAAIRQLRKTLAGAKSPQSLAIATGVLIDKALLLDALVERIEDRQVQLSQAQGQAIGAVIELALGGLGVPVTPAVRAVVAGLLQQAGRGDVLAVSPAVAEPARADVRAAIMADERGLPAPAVDDQEPDDVVTESEPVEHDDVEVVDAVVVDELEEPPQHYRDAYPTEAAAKQAWNARLRREAQQAQREADKPPSFTSYRRSVHRGLGDIFQSTMRNPPGGG